MKNKMKYHITLTDNETGEIITDADIFAIFGAIAHEDGVAQCAFSHGASNMQTACALVAANEVLEMVVNDCGEMMKELVAAIMEERNESYEQ